MLRRDLRQRGARCKRSGLSGQPPTTPITPAWIERNNGIAMSIPFSTPIAPSKDNRQQTIENQKKPLFNKEKEDRKKWLKLSLRIGCTLLLFFFLFKSISWSVLLDKLHDLDDGELLMGVIVGAAGVIISCYQWQCLLDAEHIRMDLRKLINFYFVGIAFNHFLPTGMGGDVVKAYYTGRETNNTAGAASAVLLSRITGFFGMLFVSIPALMLWHSLFNHQITIAYILSCLAMCTAVVVAGFLAAQLPRLFQGRLAKQRLIAPVLKVGNALTMSARRPVAMGNATIFGICFHLVACLNYYSYGVMLHLNIPFSFYLVAVPFVFLIAFLPISINGFGLREGAFVYMFSTVHVAPTTALLLAFMVDIQTLFFGVIGGCIYLLMGQSKKAMIVEQPQQMETRDARKTTSLLQFRSFKDIQ